ASDPHARPAAVRALWAVGRDQEKALPLLGDLLAERAFFKITAAADVAGEIGPPAAAVLPRLAGALAHSYEWVRVHCAAAIWEISGEADAPAILETLLQAW